MYLISDGISLLPQLTGDERSDNEEEEDAGSKTEDETYQKLSNGSGPVAANGVSGANGTH